MSSFYSLKRLWLWSLVTTCFFGSVYGESTDVPNPPIFFQEGILRYEITLQESVEQFSICGLVPGEQYDIVVNGKKSASECQFLISPLQSGQIGNDEIDPNTANLQLSFIAETECRTISIINNNCFADAKYTVYLTILDQSCKDVEDGGFLPEMDVVFVGTGYTDVQLIENIFIAGGCFEVLNIQGIGNVQGRGGFAGGSTSVGMQNGIIFSSGAITNAPGPNNSEGTTTNLGANGDPDLNTLAGTNTNDASGMEFDFIPSLAQITFNYVFASEEYCEYVGSFNDAFGFFISGPGINGTFLNNAENIAVIPQTTDYVAINTVNHQTNTAYFNSNSSTCGAGFPPVAPLDVEYDGFTTVLQAVANVIPCETYHIKLVVADAGDSAWDSAVFLEANSFTAGGEAFAESSIPGLNGDIAYEGCGGAEIIFQRWGMDVSQDLIVPFTIGASSTATDGVDYASLPSSVTIPAFQASVSIPLIVFEDFIAEGIETIVIELTSSCACFNPTLEILIADMIPLGVIIDDIEACGVTEITMTPTVSGGVEEYTYLWSTGSTDPELVITIGQSTSFDVTVTDVCGNTISETGNVNFTPIPSASISGSPQVCAESPNAQLQIDFQGQAPWEFSYIYNGTTYGPIVTSDNPYLLDINQAGTFSLADVATNLCPGTVSGTVEVNWLEVAVSATSTDLLCYEIPVGTASAVATGAVEPYTYQWSNFANGSDIFGLPIGTYTVTATDAIGCTEETTVTITQPTELTASAIPTQQIDCNNPFGEADLTFGGGTPGYSFFWDSGSSDEDPVDLFAGDNTVIITDDNGCTVETTVFIEEDIEIPTPEGLVSDPLSCIVTSVFLDASSSYGNGTLAFEWIDDLGNFIGNTAIVSVSNPGIYILTLTDLDNGCINFLNLTVLADLNAPTSVITANGLIDCNNATVTLNGNGSSGNSISYEWLNQGGGNIGNGSTVNVNTPGTYSLIVTDGGNGCTNISTYEVMSNTTVPVALISSTDTLGCLAGTATLDGSGSSGSGTITYQWLDAGGLPIGTNPTVNVGTTGSYTLVVTDNGNGCTSSTAFSVPENTTPPPATASVSGPLTCSDLMATLTGDDVNGTYDLQWYDTGGTPIGAGVGQVDVTDPGNYTLIVSNPTNGCTAEAIVAVSQDITLPTAEAGPQGTITCSSGAANLSGNGSSTGTDYTYAWYNTNNVLVSTDINANVNEAGDYTLVVTNTTNGCTASDMTSVVPDVNLPSVLISNPDILNCNNSAVDINGSGSGSGTLTYGWLDPSGAPAGSTPTINVNTPGIYTLVVTNTDNGCSAEASVEVLLDESLPIPLATTSDIISCINTTGLLDGSGSTSNGTLLYEWLDPSGTSIGSNSTVSVGTAGQYTLIVTNSDNGCSATGTVVLPENNDTPIADAAASGLITCIDLMVSLDGSGSSSNGTVTYEWFNGNTSLGTDEMIDVTATGTYTLVVTDSQSGCTNTTTIAVADDLTAPSAVANANTLLDCANASVTIDGSGSSGSGTITYEWLNENGSPIGTGTTVDVSAVGTYTLIVTNTSNGCTAETTASVAANSDLPVVDATALNQITCVVSTASLEGNASTAGTFTYSWLDPSGTEISTNQNVDVSAIGTYTFIALNTDNGCSSEVTVEVMEDILAPTVEAGDNGLLTCDISDVTLSGSGSAGADLEWFNPTGVPIGTANDISVSEVGTYTLVATNPTNGCTAEDVVTVAPDTNLPVAIAGNGGELNCFDNTFTLDGSASTANGTISYEWTDTGGTVIDNNSTTDVTVPGTYILMVTDEDNGCTATITVEVTQDLEEPTPVIDVSGLLDCVNASVTLDGGNSSGNGAVTYEWLNSNGSPIGTGTTVDVSAVGDYTLIVTNVSNGCTSEIAATVAADSDFPIVDAIALNQLTCDLTTATLEGSATGVGTFSYSWLDPTNTEIGTNVNIDVTTIGTYTFIANNLDNGCSSEVTVDVTADIANPISEAGIEAFLTCDITTVTLNGSGAGASNLSYEWLNPTGVPIGTTTSIDVTESGSYTLIVTNTDNGCTAMDQTQVSPDANLPVALAGNGGELTCLNSTYILDGSSSTANGTIQYQWQDDIGTVLSNTAQYTAGLPGVYTLLITDADNGCTSTATVQVTENIANPTSAALASNLIDCINTSSLLDGTGSTAGGSISYEWLDATSATIGNAATLDVTNAGIYTLIITDDANGCTAETTVEVFANNIYPTVSAATNGMLTCTNGSVELLSTASGSSTNINYSWQFPAGTEIGTSDVLTTTTPGTYLLIVTDGDNGCTSETSVMVNQDINDPIAITGNDATLTCDVSSVILTGNGSSTGANIIYEWTNASGLVVSTDIDATVSGSGLYTLLVTNTDNGCTAMATNTVVPDANLPTAFASVVEVLTCDNNSATLDGSGSSNGPNIVYEWFDSSGSPLSTDLLFDVSTAGTYTLIVTDNGNGCTASYPVEVMEDIAIPTADAGTAPLLTCDVTTVTLDGSNSSANTGVLDFEWFDPSGISISNVSTVDIGDGGIYELIVTAENGCTNSATLEVLVDADVPVADAGLDATIDCNTSSFTIGGTATSTGPNISYEWLDANNLVIGTTPTIDVSQQGTYTLVVTNTDSNCSTEQSVDILENTTLPDADAGNGGLLTCDNTEINLGGPNTTTGTMITYSWTDINGTEISTSAETMTTIPGTYSLLVTDTENGCTANTTLIIDQDVVAPQADAGLPGILTCDVTSVTLDGSGSSTGNNISYQWLNASNTPVGDQVTIDVTGTGDYTLIVTNTDNGCTATSMTSVTPDAALPTAIAGAGGTITCQVLDVQLDGIASSTISGQIEYEWFNELNQSLSNISDLNTTQAGIYTLVITDPANGCSTSDAVEVMLDIAEPDVNPGSDQILDCGTTSLDLNGSAGNGTNFTFEWFDPNGISISNTADANATIAGTYTLEVTNIDNGCMSSATMEITPDINVPTAFAGNDAILTCVIDDVTLSAAGSSTGPTIDYQWSNAAGSVIGNTQTITVSGVGIYTLLVIDSSNGCQSTDIVEVTADMVEPVPEISPVGPTSISCSTSSIILDGSQSSPIGNLSFSWSTTNGTINGGANTDEIEAGSAGTYELTVTNLTNGCENTTTFMVDEDMTLPSAIIANPSLLTCDLTEFNLNANGSSTGANIIYNWQGPAGGITGGITTLEPSIILPGTYILTVTNEENGCENTAEVLVLQNIAEPEAVATVTELLDCVTETVTISGNGSATGTGITYNWGGPGIISGANTLSPDANVAGTYTLTVFDPSNGCDNTASVEVEEDENVLSAIEFLTTEPVCFGETGTIAILEVVGGQMPYQYSLDDETYGNSNFFPDLDPGTYTLYVEDAIGCHHEQEIVIPFVEELTVGFETDISTISLGGLTQLVAEVNIPTSQIDHIDWSPVDSLSCSNCLTPNANPQNTTDYTVIVTDLNGCTASAKIRLSLDKERDIFFPTAFSPNNDGNNDFFTIFANDKNILRINEFHVYNRWGEIMFENIDFLPNVETEGWDGRFKGQIMDAGVFVYWAKIEFVDGFIGFYKGDVTLIK